MEKIRENAHGADLRRRRILGDDQLRRTDKSVGLAA